MASVASRNPFDLLGESTDPEAVAKEVEQSKEQPVVIPKKVDRSRASPKEARIRHEYPQRGGHKPSASNRNNEDTRSGAPRDRNVGPRLSRREEGGGGGGGGDYHPTRTPRGARPSDRSRGGGIAEQEDSDDSEKKENQGWGKPTETPWDNNTATENPSWNAEPSDANASSSWGDNANDANAGNWGDNKTTEENNDWSAGVAVPEESNTTTNDSWNNSAEKTENSSWEQQPETNDAWNGDEAAKNEDTAANESTPAPEPEENQKTLDEYRAEKAQKLLDITLPEARKPNEGVDDSQWKDAVPLEKDEEDDFLFTGKEQSYRLKNKKNKSKNFVEITQTFERHGGGGGGGRSGVVNLDDQSAFPSLGAS
ncbi:13411_t:CDS:2 [Rhizophagus irregularis]|nr:13411_t:CDS:2 [Rhizophagus irregularis]